MRDNVFADARLIEQGHYSVGMTLNLPRNLVSHEWTFCIPPQQHLVV
jgi:hypothetical protein